MTKPPIHFMRVTFSSAATHVPTDYSALFDKERPMPVDVSLDSIRYRVGETMGVGYDDGASESSLQKSILQSRKKLNLFSNIDLFERIW